MRPANLTLDALSRDIAALQRQVRDLQSGTVSPGTVDHTTLSNLNSANYSHLTAANLTDLTDGGATTLHTHAAPDHAALSNLNSTDYSHLTAAQVTDLTDGGATTLHSHAAASVSIPGLCNGRLTLESGVAVSSSDQAAKATVYFTPYGGNQIALYNGATWDVVAFAEISVSLVGTTASKPYDVFCYNNSGTAALETLVWTSASARATALALQDGVLVKSGAATRRYLGTIYVNSSGGQTDDTITKRNVWNYYNRVPRRLYVTEATSHKYNGAARLWNNSETDNRLEFVAGVAEDAQTYTISARLIGGADGSYAIASPYLDGSEVSARYRCTNLNNQAIVAGMAAVDTPAAGFHYLNTYELGNHNSSTMVSMMLGAQVRG